MVDQKQNLILVEDDPAVRSSMAMVLAEMGYSVRTAEDGFSALAEIRKEVPEILISDLNMPGMSGFEFLSVIRRRFPMIKVVAMSGAFNGDSIPTGVAADEFYQKCSGIKPLLRALSALGSRDRVALSHPPAPVWVPLNGRDQEGQPFVTITCPECMRTFSKSPVGRPLQIHHADCIHCASEVLYAVVMPPEEVLAQLL